MKNKILIIGATSAIAQQIAKKFAMDNHELYLVGRNPDRLATIAQDLTIRSNNAVKYAALDVNEFEKHSQLIDSVIKEMGNIDIVLIAHGSLSNQAECEKSYVKTVAELATNCLSVISLLTYLANYFEQQKRGSIAVISSVAGDRGRQSNYIYGTGKGALNVFLQGLRNRLAKANVNVLTVKPGFVDTPMTQHYKKRLLWASPEAVSADIVKGIYKKKNVIYTPRWWWLIMTTIKLIPETIFKKLKL